MSKRWDLTADDPVRTGAKGHKAARIALWSMRRHGDDVEDMARVVITALGMLGPNSHELMSLASRVRHGLICWRYNNEPLRAALAECIPAFGRECRKAAKESATAKS